MRLLLTLTILFCFNIVKAQHSLTAIIQDSTNKTTIPGATIKLKNTTNGTITNGEGKATLKNIPSGAQTFVISNIGYTSKEPILIFPLQKADEAVIFMLSPAENVIDEVVISSSRTNSRIEDLPTKVEVLGAEDMEEENQVKPGNVASILGDLSVIHVQQTSAVTGNTTIRMQGLDGRYTQLLRDGLPLFGGFSGNFGVLSIPPLDLKQIEIIKGSSSTLYGGGAIAGLINFISKIPAKERELSFTLNRSTLKESNLNTYYSQRFNKLGITLLAQQTIQDAVDVNKDGFSDVAKINTTIIHPRLFYYINDHSRLDAGYAFTYDNRRGGDMQVIAHRADIVHQYIEENRSARNTIDFHYQNDPDTIHHFTLKGSASNYDLTNNDAGFKFKGNQLTDYFEASDLIKIHKNDIVIGLNYTGEYFRKGTSDPTALNDYNYHTLGGFVQDGWHVADKLLIESGLRADHHNQFGWFVLPRIAFLYRPQDVLSIRLSGGLGYKAPNIFIPETLAGGYGNLLPISNSLKSERSQGVNFDANYHIRLGEDASLDIDQALYYTHIDNPLTPVLNANNTISLSNFYRHVNAVGTDTYLRFKIDDLELYFGFNHTISKEAATASTNYLPFSPQNKASTTIAYDIEGKWRFGVEASYEADQYINVNQRVPNTFFMAGMAERKFGPKTSLVLNCENISDFRQSNYEALYTGSVTNPVFKPIWGPIDGRVFNLALRIKI